MINPIRRKGLLGVKERNDIRRKWKTNRGQGNSSSLFQKTGEAYEQGDRRSIHFSKVIIPIRRNELLEIRERKDIRRNGKTNKKQETRDSAILLLRRQGRSVNRAVGELTRYLPLIFYCNSISLFLF